MSQQEIARAIEGWFIKHLRPLPWRETGSDGLRDPYRSLVSEFMLQQTQVSRVLEKFAPFIERFPSVRSLAASDEHDVLAAWSGLGYYSRARRLHAAAKAIVERHDGEVPSDVESLRSLPGVGRYTAGAIASMVFHQREPLVDGNVQRVFVRLHDEEMRLGVSATERWAWDRAGELVEICDRPGVLNEGLMELGATVCTPRGAKCSVCPVLSWCDALETGRQEELPLPKPRANRRDVWHGVALCVEDDRILLVRRPDQGLWAGMWAPPTLERDDRSPTVDEVGTFIGGAAQPEHEFTHETTHRSVRFVVFEAESWEPAFEEQASTGWFTLSEAERLALSNAHVKIIRRALSASRAR